MVTSNVPAFLSILFSDPVIDSLLKCIGESRVMDSYSPPSPMMLMPYLSRSFTRSFLVSASRFLPSHPSSRPSAKTPAMTASIPAETISSYTMS